MSVQNRLREEGADREQVALEARVAAARAAEGGQRTPMLDPAAAAAAERARKMAVEAQEAPDPVAPRPSRRPFGAQEQTLAWPSIPGFRLYWFNDVPGRIDRAQEAGYAHVTDDQGANVKRVTGKGENGHGLQSFLMKIPEGWYMDDQRAVQTAESEKLRDIREGRSAEDRDGAQYVPRRGIKIAAERR